VTGPPPPEPPSQGALDGLIRFSLRHRAAVLTSALLVLLAGASTLTELPVEVLPDMTRPTVTVLTEAPGLAPEETEAIITQPIEAALQGLAGLDRLRSDSDVGLSLVFAEFAWGTDLLRARQQVQERLQPTLRTLPSGVRAGMTPVSSLMGEILLVGLRCDDGSIPTPQLRTLADWTIRRRLQSISGVAEVLTIGGGVRQLEVQPDLRRMAAAGVTLAELEHAVTTASGNATSGYLQDGSREIMVRQLNLSVRPEDIAATVVRRAENQSILISDVAAVREGVAPMRGDASINGSMGVILSIDKAPGTDTLQLTRAIEAALRELQPTLPRGVRLEVLFRQGDFIDHAISNLREAIRDGAIMVAAVLLLFLTNVRTTLVTLTAIPLSFAVTIIMFRLAGVSVNSMTLGGLAVAIGMVVDDAIVDVENVWRRLRSNAASASPRPRLQVIAAASGEVRHSILYATVLVILVFLPLLGLEGLEGRLFTPIAVATITSMAASFVVSLTVIPVLCSFLLRPRAGPAAHHDGPAVRLMKWLVRHTFLRAALAAPALVLAFAGILLLAALTLYPSMGREFLPTFNEGSATISLVGAPGTSLAQSNETGETAVRLLQTIPEVRSVGRRAGRAERDDHVMPVSVNEFDVEFHGRGRPRDAVFAEIRAKLGSIPGTVVNVGQPIGHRLSHMLSGVSAKIAVKISGPELDVLRSKGAEVRELARQVPGLTDVSLEAQVPIPQLRIAVDRERARVHGVTPNDVSSQVSTLVGGRLLAELREGQRTFDLVLRLPESWRRHPTAIGDLLIETPGGRIPLALIASVRETSGPSVVRRENTQRRIVISANTGSRDLASLAQRWESLVRSRVSLPEGYALRFEGEFQAREAAARRIAISFGLVLLIVTVLLTTCFQSLSLALQVLLNIPLALIGGLALTAHLIGNISIATIVGFIAVGGVAARNGIMMISHYLHLMQHEGESFSRSMIIRGTLERLVPVLMTALSAGMALVPLVLSAGEPGKEILHPVAVVMAGGLISSTFLDLMVTPAAFWLFGRNASRRAAPPSGTPVFLTANPQQP
jgi:CzcA family heavy metal efflux pump